MSSTPYNIFSQKCDPAAALEKLLEWVPGAKVAHHPDGQWSEVTGEWKRGFLQKPLKISITHSPDYYAGPGWPEQVAGMQGYFSRFAGIEKRPDVLEYLSGLRFALSFILDPDDIKKDPRTALVFQMAQELEGVIFLPGCLVNASMDILVAVDGSGDPAAQLPDFRSPVVIPKQEGMDEAADVDEEPDPPEEDRVIHRLLVMIDLAERGFMEAQPSDMMEKRRRDLVEALESTPAWVEAEPREATALQCPIGTLNQKDAWQLPWLSEGAMVLAWSLGLAELPPYDQQVDVYELYAIKERLNRGESSINLRSMDDLEDLSFQMLAIHWRLRQFQMDHKPMDFVSFAPKAWCGPMDLTLARIMNNDLEINGQPLSDSPEKNWVCASGIMHERRMAIHWLLGHASVYSENDTST